MRLLELLSSGFRLRLEYMKLRTTAKNSKLKP
jgi:hypothetical protein